MIRSLLAYGTEIRLPNGEGSITIWTERKLTAEEIAKIKIDDDWSVRLTHSYHCQGVVGVQTISKTKHAIFCKKCYMRLLVPIEILTLGDLVVYIEKNFFEKP